MYEMNTLSTRLSGKTPSPFKISCGTGVNSVAMLVLLARRVRAGESWCRPEAILMADTGDEKPETYAYIPVLQQWLQANGFPHMEIVRYKPSRTKNGPYSTLEENCLVNATLPSLAFGWKKCSLKWKRQPQDKWLNHWAPAQAAWQAGRKVIVAIGYDAGVADSKRAWNIQDDAKFDYIYPLRDYGWDRDACVQAIQEEGLPVPVKSACFYCPASKPDEIEWLAKTHPDMAHRIIRMEMNAKPNLKKVQGLWRTATKTRPGSMSVFLVKNKLVNVSPRIELEVLGQPAAPTVVRMMKLIRPDQLFRERNNMIRSTWGPFKMNADKCLSIIDEETQP